MDRFTGSKESGPKTIDGKLSMPKSHDSRHVKKKVLHEHARGIIYKDKKREHSFNT